MIYGVIAGDRLMKSYSLEHVLSHANEQNELFEDGQTMIDQTEHEIEHFLEMLTSFLLEIIFNVHHLFSALVRNKLNLYEHCEL